MSRPCPTRGRLQGEPLKQPSRNQPFQQRRLSSLAGLTAQACLIGFALAPALARQANRPNIIVIIADDLAAREPQRLAQLQKSFDQQAKANKVYPLGAGQTLTVELKGSTLQPSDRH
jgi:hypothetical protein